jgi:Leucine-rich repeat (LRR) protein
VGKVPQMKLKSLKSLHSLVNVVHLDVSGHGLSSMDGLDCFPRIVHLNLARNNIKQLRLPRLKSLESLDLSGNFISQLPKCLEHLATLKILHLAGNSLNVLNQIDILAPLANLHTVLTNWSSNDL